MSFCFGARRRQRFAGYTIAINAGDSQSGTVGTALSTALSVVVRAPGTGAVVSGATVFWVDSGDGSIVASSQTNGSGVASATWGLGTFAGAQRVTATVAGGGSVTFTATATAAAAATITAASVVDQSAATSTAVGVDPSVFVVDAFGNPVSGVSVTWAVASGGGSVNTTGGTTTGSDGLATVTSWTLGGSIGANSLTATSAGLTGSPVTFTASATAAAPATIAVVAGGTQTGVVAGQASSAITYRVKDSGNNALEGVTVSFSRTGNGTLSASTGVTNASGDASVTLTTHTTVETATVAAECPDGAGGVILGSTTVSSTFGAASRLNIVTQPAASGTSGVALSQQPIIEVTDVNGNRVTSSTATVTATVATGNAQIAAGNTAVASSGVATFSGFTLNDTDGGSNTIQFGSGALTVAVSQGVTLAPPVPAKLGVAVQPSAVGVGAAISPAPTCEIQDSDGNRIAGATNAVTVSLGDNGEGATLSGTLTVNAVDGTATFSGLTVDIEGSYTLVYASGSLTGATSSAFTVSAASSSYPNLPVGFTEIVRMKGDTVPTTSYAQVTGWTGFFIKESGTITSQTDATAPLTPSGVWRTRYNTNHPQGTAPCNVGSWANNNYSSPTQYSKLYLSMRIKIGTTSGFLNHPAGTKMGFVCYAEPPSSARNQMFWMFRGVGGTSATNMTASKFSVNQQSNLGGANRVMVPASGNIVTTGVWHHVEMLCEVNSAADVADGILKMWVNGTQTLNVSNVVYKHSGNTRGFQWYAWNPTWGGNTTGVTHAGSTDDILIDDYSIYGQL